MFSLYLHLGPNVTLTYISYHIGKMWTTLLIRGEIYIQT